MRKHWIDNLRWVTVLLVLLYHVFYFYNNKGVFGGIGGFGEWPQCKQYQDVIMYTRKLLVPSTIGLFVFHWMVGYFNTVVASREGVFDGIPAVAKYMLMAVSGTGPLWFIQVLWLLCLVLLLVRKLDKKDRFWNWCGKANIVWIILMGVLFWVGTLTLVRNPRPDSMDGLLNLYKPLFYLIPFLMGYFVFSHDEVQETLGKAWIPLLACAVISGGILIGTTFGQDNTSPQYLSSPLNVIYGWLMCLAMMAWFKARFDCTSPAVGHVRHPDGRGLHPLAPPLRNHPPDSFRPLGGAGREEESVITGSCSASGTPEESLRRRS